MQLLKKEKIGIISQYIALVKFADLRDKDENFYKFFSPWFRIVHKYISKICSLQEGGFLYLFGLQGQLFTNFI